jgi:asparagine N-glycosylation enzyme membrane subunit Stt3
MEGSHTGWWRRHGWTVAILLSAFGVSFAIRTIWAYPVIAQYGPLYTYAGGSDSYYHSRVMSYIILNHTNLVHDPLLHFPLGSTNPREPLFDWMNAILGMVFAPFFGGNAIVAGAWFLDLQAPLWAALGVIPVYLIGREVANRRVGLIAAVIFPFLSANIDSSTFGYANYLSFYTFFVLVTVYCYLRTVKAVGNRRWIESYRHPRQYVPGLRAFLRTERTAVKWAVFTGVSLGALALAWQGYTLDVVVIGVSVLVALFAERIRRVDSFGLYVSTWIVGLIAFPMEMPYYLTQYGTLTSPGFETYFVLQAIIFFGVLLLLLPFLLMRDVPWVLSIPILIGIVLAGVGALALVDKSLFTTLITGQGYFVKTLVYSTVAEAQAPSIDALVVGFGVITFFLAFAGLGLFVYQLARGRFKRVHIVFVVFAVVSIYLPISATKFFLVASPIFALLPAEAIRRMLDVGGYSELRRTTASLSDRRSQFAAFRRAFKARHVLIMGLVVGLILPNIWVAIDAGIPGNTKSGFADQVAATLPPWLQLNTSNPSSYYFGAAGSSLDTPNQYDSAGYNWLATRDTTLPPQNRPAVVSWWDYGFQTIDQGQHPSVADNFQDGIDPAGQFLLAQNESQAIAVLATTLIQSVQVQTHEPYLPSALNRIIAEDGLNVSRVHSILVNTSEDYRIVVANPQTYLPVNPSTLTDANALYIAMEVYMATALPISGVAKFYNDVQAYTGWSIGYALSDSRLFPFSGTDTGIYYAPVDLTGRVVDSAGVPLTFFNVTVSGSDGNTYPLGSVPADVSAVNYNINYFAPFYNSMIYHIYIGYNGTDVGLGQGIPGLEGSTQLLSSPLMPGWMLQHFQVVYRTAYYCPQANVSASAACLSATNLPTAEALAAKDHGTADTSADAYFSGGESFLQYYPGQTLLGTVATSSGAPVAGAQVTVDDGWGIPHMTTHTTSDGSFSVVLPPGNDTLNITTGSQNLLLQQGNLSLDSVHLTVPNSLGLSLDTPPLLETFHLAPAKVQGFVYWNANNSTSYDPTDPLVPGAQIVLWGPNGTARVTAATDASGAFQLSDVAPGTYNYSVIYGGHNFTQSTLYITPGAQVNATAALTPGYLSGTVIDASGAAVAGSTVTLTNSSGVVAQSISNGTGGYRMASVGPGNYTLTAAGPIVGERSPGQLVVVPSAGSSVTTELTVVPMSTVSFSVLANGAPAAAIPVRFVPVASFHNASSSPIGAISNATSQGTVVVSGPSGGVTATLPAGTYSVYALGYVGSGLYSAVSNVTVGPLEPSIVPSLGLTPGVPVSGTVRGLPGQANGSETAIVAYSSSGGDVTTWASANGSFAMTLPGGTYSVLSLTGTSSESGSSIRTGLSTLSVAAPSATLSIVPGASVVAHFGVGKLLPNGSLFPSASPNVVLSASAIGASVPALGSSNGSVTLYAPSTVPGGGTYCLSASAFGFGSTSRCSLTPSSLSQLTTFPLPLTNVSVTLRVTGLPSGTRVTVNLSAESPTATNFTFTGGPNFGFRAPPGLYGVGARATIANSTTVYLPATILSTTIPVGATYSNLTLLVIPKVTAKGTLSIPSKVPLGNVTITLGSPNLGNFTVNGTVFTKGFYAAPGTYSVSATYSQSGTNYTNLTHVSVASNGVISPMLRIDTAGVDLIGTFQSGSTTLPLNTTVAVIGPTGAKSVTTSLGGKFTVPVPPSVPYSIFANATLLTSGPNGSFYRAYRVSPGATCSPNATVETCSIPTVGTPIPWWINGTVSSSGIPTPIAGSATLVGPYPYANVTTVSVANGAFSARVAPGAYSVYVNGSGAAAGRAAFGSALALPSVHVPVAVTLQPTWMATLTVVPPGGSVGNVGPATVVLRNAAGQQIAFPGIPSGGQVSIAVPTGTYGASARAGATIYGEPVNLTGVAAVTVARGNVAINVPLKYPVSYAVRGTLVGPPTATVRAGGTVRFAFSVRATGTEPVTITPVGTPSYWTFGFSFSSVSLTPGPTGTNVSGEVSIGVPAGTAVAHPGVTIDFELANGTVVGSVSPAPTIQIVPQYGVGIGASASSASQVGTDHVQQPFYVVNSGNVAETVALSIVDAARLATYGWTATIHTAAQAPVSEVNLTAGQNATYLVDLNVSALVFLPPGSISLSAAVVNTTAGPVASTTITVPLATVHPNVPPSVTGPNIGAPPALPDWFVPVIVFVPAIALALAIISYRWWRTRRWTRR